MNLPGNTRDITKLSITCARENCDRKATIRVQGETDSFGAEFEELCETCYAQDLANEAAERAAGTHWLQTAHCDWCKKSGQPDVRHTRDPDEGMGGPVYLVCSACRNRRDDADAAEYRFEQLRKMGYSSEEEYEAAQQEAEDRLWEDEDEARHLNRIWTPELARQWARDASDEAILGYCYDPSEYTDLLHAAALEEDASRAAYY